MWKTPRSLAVAGVALAAGLGVGAVAVPAFAAQDPILTEDQRETLQSQVDAYQACLQQQGVTLPEKPADGTRTEPTDEQRRAMKAARDACEDRRPERPELSEDQQAELQSQLDEYRACMDEQLSAAGIAKPEKPAEGTAPGQDGQGQPGQDGQGQPGQDGQGQQGQPGRRPARAELTDEQQAALASARTACADLQPNLGVDGLGPMGGPGGHGRPGGPGGRPGPSGTGSEQTTGAAA